ncbi:N-acetylmuramate alpha-1-phosphate uridylyltransferase [Azospirillaceae bacterium]
MKIPVPCSSTTGFIPRCAMVLAAGLGLRMRPLTLTRPKPLIEVAGKTLLDHALDRVSEAGVETAVVNSHYKGEMIAEHLAGRVSPKIVLAPEDELLETGGGVRRNRARLGADPAFVINADILWLNGPQPALCRLAGMWDPQRMDALLLMTPTVKAVGYTGRGDYFMDGEGRLTRRKDVWIAPFVFAGVHIVKPEMHDPMPDGPYSNNQVWDRIAQQGRLYGLVHDGAWFHIGTPEALGEARERLDLYGLRWVEH